MAPSLNVLDVLPLGGFQVLSCAYTHDWKPLTDLKAKAVHLFFAKNR